MSETQSQSDSSVDQIIGKFFKQPSPSNCPSTKSKKIQKQPKIDKIEKNSQMSSQIEFSIKNSFSDICKEFEEFTHQMESINESYPGTDSEPTF